MEIYSMKKTAIILGATGLTGSILLEMLLEDSSFEKIKLFSRSSAENKSPKIEEHLIDMFQLEDYSEAFKADVVFCCIGTTKSKTPNKETYKKIDYGIPVTAAKLAKQNGISTFIVISALGADENSSVFYNKTKGEMQRDVLKQHIENTYILQPSLIVGDRGESRLGEKVATLFMKTFGFLIPKKYKMIKAETIAEAMVVLAKQGFPKQQITSDEIKQIAIKTN
nr:NAD(P)H-binding protein [Aequorivita sublithincola]